MGRESIEQKMMTIEDYLDNQDTVNQSFYGVKLNPVISERVRNKLKCVLNDIKEFKRRSRID